MSLSHTSGPIRSQSSMAAFGSVSSAAAAAAAADTARAATAANAPAAAAAADTAAADTAAATPAAAAPATATTVAAAGAAASALRLERMLDSINGACVVRDAYMRHKLAVGSSSWCTELESRATQCDLNWSLGPHTVCRSLRTVRIPTAGNRPRQTLCASRPQAPVPLPSSSTRRSGPQPPASAAAPTAHAATWSCDQPSHSCSARKRLSTVPASHLDGRVWRFNERQRKAAKGTKRHRKAVVIRGKAVFSHDAAAACGAFHVQRDNQSGGCALQGSGRSNIGGGRQRTAVKRQ